jgi:hypothetical protein
MEHLMRLGSQPEKILQTTLGADTKARSGKARLSEPCSLPCFIGESLRLKCHEFGIPDGLERLHFRCELSKLRLQNDQTRRLSRTALLPYCVQLIDLGDDRSTLSGGSRYKL